MYKYLRFFSYWSKQNKLGCLGIWPDPLQFQQIVDISVYEAQPSFKLEVRSHQKSSAWVMPHVTTRLSPSECPNVTGDTILQTRLHLPILMAGCGAPRGIKVRAAASQPSVQHRAHHHKHEGTGLNQISFVNMWKQQIESPSYGLSNWMIKMQIDMWY